MNNNDFIFVVFFTSYCVCFQCNRYRMISLNFLFLCCDCINKFGLQRSCMLVIIKITSNVEKVYVVYQKQKQQQKKRESKYPDVC